MLLLVDHLDGLAPEAAIRLLSTIANPSRIEADDPVAIAASRNLAERVGTLPPLAFPVSLPVQLLRSGAISDEDFRVLAASQDARESHSQNIDIAPSKALAGAFSLASVIPEEGGVLAFELPLVASREGRVHLGLDGDLLASSASFTAEAFDLRGAAPDQVSLRIPRGTSHLRLILRIGPRKGSPPILHLRFTPGITRAEASPANPPNPSRPANPFRLDLPKTALANDLDALLIRRSLGLPEPGATLEERLASATGLEPLDLLLALGALTTPELKIHHLERALAHKPSPLLSLALAELAMDSGQFLRARAALDAVPSSLSPTLETRLHRLTRHPELALARLGLTLPITSDALLETLSQTPTSARLELAEALLALGFAPLSAAIFGDLVLTFPGRVDLRVEHIGAALAAGLTELALADADLLATLHPERPIFALDAASKRLDRGLPDDLALARRHLSDLSPRIARSPDHLEQLGRLYERLGDRPAARATYKRVLALVPTHTEARAHLERLEGASPPPLTLDLSALETAPLDPSAAFEVLGEELFVRVDADGRATRWNRRILRAQRVPESRDARTFTVRFDPTQSSIHVLGAFIHRPGRAPEPVFDRTVNTLSEDWYGLYYDLRELAIPFDRLAPGDLLDVSWRVDPIGQIFPGLFDLYEVLSDRIPKHLYKATIEAPTSLRLKSRLSPPNPAIRETRTPDGDLLRLTLEARDLPALRHEPLAPGASEIAPIWQVSTFSSWAEVAAFYRNLIAPSKVLTPAMRARVAELSRGRTPDETRRLILDLVTRDIRYVGLEFGIHGYLPYRTDDVLSRGFGDCKDKSTLLVTLLAEAGLPAEVSLVRTRRQGRPADPLPSIALFDHAIAYLPDRDQFVDPTSLHHGLGELPAPDQGALALVLTDSADLRTIPVDPPSRNGLRGDYSITLDTYGRGGLAGTVSFYGHQAATYRERLLDPSTRARRLTELLSGRYPGLALGDHRLSDPADTSRPLDLTFSGEVPRLASPFPGELQVPRPAGLDGQVERLCPTETRTHPLVLGPPSRVALKFRYLLPDGYRAVDLPPNGSSTSPFGRFQVDWLDEGAVVTVSAEFELDVDQVSASDYPAFRAFIRALDAAVSPALVVRRVPPAEAP